MSDELTKNEGFPKENKMKYGKYGKIDLILQKQTEI